MNFIILQRSQGNSNEIPMLMPEFADLQSTVLGKDEAFSRSILLKCYLDLEGDF